jgi:CBS domain-containing protein
VSLFSKSESEKQALHIGSAKRPEKGNTMEEILVKSIMSTTVETIETGESLKAVAQRMRNNKISCVIVTGSNGPEGIITERDIVRLLAANLDFEETKAGKVMNTPLKIMLRIYKTV